MAIPRTEIKLPELAWKRATCEVCGESFEYLGKRQPHTCKTGECIYRFKHLIEPAAWASYQPTLFDSVRDQ